MDRLATELLKIAKELVGAFPDQPAPWGKETEDLVEKQWNEAVEKLGKKLDKNKSFYWEPGRSLALNIPMTGGLNSWTFNLFPYFGRVWDGESIIIEPKWSSSDKTHSSHVWPPMVDKIIDMVKRSMKISDQVDQQLDNAEKKFGIKIPAGVRGDIQKYVKKVAKGRQTGNRLRVKPKLFSVVKEDS